MRRIPLFVVVLRIPEDKEVEEWILIMDAWLSRKKADASKARYDKINPGKNYKVEKHELTLLTQGEIDLEMGKD